MRITNNFIQRNYLNDVNTNLEYLTKLQDQEASGSKIRRPSDDPFNAARAIDVNNSINRDVQYAENLEDAKNWLNTTDDALNKVGEYIQRITDQINAASNKGTLTATELFAYKKEVQENIEGITDMLNTSYNGSYIFGGYKSTTKPVDVVKDANGVTGVFKRNYDTADTDSSDPTVTKNPIIGEQIIREISPGVTMNINITADQILGIGSPSSMSESLSTTLKNVVEALTDPNKRENFFSTDGKYLFLDKLQTARDSVSRLRAQVGAKQNRIESAAANNELQSNNLTGVLDKIAGVDIAEIHTKVDFASAAYQASLMVGAKVIQPSLLDFLK